MNQRRTITVDNLKCGGCSATISKRLSALDGVTAIQVDAEAEEVSFSSPVEVVALVRETLRGLGYPERGTASGLANVGAKARSFLSCAIGKVGAA
jgi:copper chaperone